MTFCDLVTILMTRGDNKGLVVTLFMTHYCLVTTPHDYIDDPCDNSDDLYGAWVK
jgi:hypothetical protein